MTSVDMNTGAYLSRIGFEGPAEPSLEVLRSLHRCHLLSVPFENLTMHSGGELRLDLPLVFDKIVNQHRGGFCYENNGLFSWLLRSLGFQVTMISGQVKNVFSKCYGPPFDHMGLLLSVDGHQWLCDVGFGGGATFTSPLLLDTEEPQQEGHRVYRIRKTPEFWFLEWQGDEPKGTAGDWMEVYKFTLQPRRLEDFKEMCRYHQSSPYSIFTCKSLCILQTAEGQLISVGRKLITRVYPAGESTREELTDDEIVAMLAESFGIVLSSPLSPKDEPIPSPPVQY